MTEPMHRHRHLSGWEWLLIVGLLVGGFWLRVVRFTEVPPGVIHDEVRTWFNTQLVLAGDIRALYPYGGGREALFMFLGAASYTLLGSNVLAGRFPSLAFSMFGIAISFGLGRRLFGQVAGVVAAAGFATSFWSVFFARFADRTGSMPVMALIVTYLFLRLIQAPRRKLALSTLIGAALGATLYTYPAALASPAVLAAWLLALTWMHPAWLRGRRWLLLLPFLIALAIAAPLMLAWADPQNSARANEVNAPLESLLSGDASPILANVLPMLGMFTVKGDHGLEFNVQDQPIFPTVPMALLFYLGLILAIAGAVVRGESPQRPGYALALIWTVGMLVPTLVTERPVNPSRTIGLLGIVYLYPAIAAAAAIRWARSVGGLRGAASAALVVALALTYQLQHTAQNYFVTWAENPVVRFLYQDEYRRLANDLASRPDRPVVAVGGLTPYEMDPASMLLLMRDDAYAGSLGFFDPQNSLLLPRTDPQDPAYVAVPAAITLHHALAERLPAWGIVREASIDAYTLYAAEFSGQQAGPVGAGRLAIWYWPDDPRGFSIATWLGMERSGTPVPGEAFHLLTFWEASGPTSTSLRIFVHLVDAEGTILAQSDVLGVPSTQWRAGDRIVQAHDLMLPPDALPGPHQVRIGLYDPATNMRMRVNSPSGSDTLQLALP